MTAAVLKPNFSVSEPELPVKYADIALQNRFVKDYSDFLRHVANGDIWFTFIQSEGRWARDEKMFVYTLAKRFLSNVAHEAFEAIQAAVLEDTKDPKKAREQAARVATGLASAPKVAAVVKLAASHPRIAIVLEEFDTDIWALNTPRGKVDLRDGTIRPATREDYFTRCTPVAPDSATETVNFDGFMFDIMGGQIPPSICKCAACRQSQGKPDDIRLALHLDEVQKRIDYTLRCYGYALTGDVAEQVLFLQIGDGGNGKGLLNDTISRHVMGASASGYACSIPIEALLMSKGERHPTDLMALRGARLAHARESDEGMCWNEGRVKSLTGGDPITARGMRQDFVTFAATHKLFPFGNVKPVVRGADQAAWKRRLHLNTFPQQFQDSADRAKCILRADKHLHEKLAAEAPGILQKLIDACLNYQKHGLKPPETVIYDSSDYLRRQNVIARWFEERCMRNERATITVKELWADLHKWADEQKEEVGASRDFRDKLEKLGVRIGRTAKQKGVCEGVGLVGGPAGGGVGTQWWGCEEEA